MTRFTAIDQSRLPVLPATALTFEQYYAAYMVDLAARLQMKGVAYNVGTLETDTYAITGQAFSNRVLLLAQSIDNAIAAVLLPWSWGPYLDALGATQDPPVQRQPIVTDPRPYVYNTPAADDWQSDDVFRALVQLAPEALSTCGPEGAYLFFALDVAGVLAASAYGPMSFGGTKSVPFLGLGEVHVPIVSETNDGTKTIADGSASPALVSAVSAALRPTDRRPLADFVTVSPATIARYTVDATLYIGSGADPGTVLTAACARTRAAADLAHRPAGQMLDQDLYAALKVPDAKGAPLVTKVRLNGWTDVNGIDPSPANPAPAFVAPYCLVGDPVITALDDVTTQIVAGGITIKVAVVDD